MFRKSFSAFWMPGSSGKPGRSELPANAPVGLRSSGVKTKKNVSFSQSAVSLMGGNQMTLSRTLKSLILGLSASALLAVSAPSFAADLVMWERSGGNKGMVDKLVEMWNAKFPDRHITLTYIPHAEMVAKLAQAIASGDVPDLMGMDLIYAPQFASAGQLENVTDMIGSDRDIQPPRNAGDVKNFLSEAMAATGI
jgi:ABC-type glycerol-3-phosphate transport system substrate-binding protein